jgi:hypothetical protein
MSFNLSKLIPDLRDLEKLAPNDVNHQMLLEVINQIFSDMESLLPPKHSGFYYETLFYVELYCEIAAASIVNATNDLNVLWKGHEKLFQHFQNKEFANGKRRRTIPDQPTMSRFENMINEEGLAEKLGNCMLLGQCLYYLKNHPQSEDTTLIADFVEEPCAKDKNDPACFGSKTGKTHHKTLTFSLIFGKTHVIIATYKMVKKQPIKPIFEEVINRLGSHGIIIKYGLFDRGFYKKELLFLLKASAITVIMPARNCFDTKRKITLWLQDKSGRTGKLFLKLRYVKQYGYPYLMMGVVLAGKRGHDLHEVKTDFKQGKITQDIASKRIFPLLVIRGNTHGIQALKGKENYVRALYRKRWAIEIAFRTTHLLGISNWIQQRDIRLFRFTCKCMIYNLWQIKRDEIQQKDPNATPVSLEEFCGHLTINRTRELPSVSA